MRWITDGSLFGELNFKVEVQAVHWLFILSETPGLAPLLQQCSSMVGEMERELCLCKIQVAKIYHYDITALQPVTVL